MFARAATMIDTLGWKRRYRAFAEGWPSTSRPNLRFFRTAKAQYRLRCEGAGPPLVFLADPPISIEAYDDLIAALTPDFRVIVVEAAAMGFSAANTAYRFGFRESNDDLATVLRAVAGEGAILAFSCVSGLGAVDIAVRHPDLVSRLCLFQTTDWTGFQNWKAARDPKGILSRPVIGQLAMRRLARRRAPTWLNLAVGKRAQLAPLCQCADHGFSHGMLFSLASSFQRYLSGPDPLGTPHQPLTIFWGLKDGSHGPESIAGSKRLAPDAEIVTYDDLGHFPELEDPTRIAAALRAMSSSHGL